MFVMYHMLGGEAGIILIFSRECEREYVQSVTDHNKSQSTTDCSLRSSDEDS